MTPKMMTTSAKSKRCRPLIALKMPITIEMIAAPAKRIKGHRVFEFADEDPKGALRLSSLRACSGHIWLFSSRLRSLKASLLAGFQFA
jgi:hypothetical protein